MNNPAQSMFEYWNEAFCSVEGFTEAGFAIHFTLDAILRVNGQDRPTGPAGLAAHFNRIRAAAEHALVQLPLEHSFLTGNNLFIHYRLDLVVDSAAQIEEAMGYCVLDETKIRLMNVVSYLTPSRTAATST